jgi:hypothetical protein
MRRTSLVALYQMSSQMLVSDLSTPSSQYHSSRLVSRSFGLGWAVSLHYVLACFYGFSAAGIQNLYAAKIYGFVGPDVSQRGSRMGFVFALIGIACLTGSRLGGWLIKLDDGKYLYA